MTTAPMLRCVPVEIEDLVIAAVSWMDSPSEELLTCALVCKSWVPASRRNLLVDGVVTIRPKVEHVQSLLAVLQSSSCTIKPYITTLSIVGKGNRNSWNATWGALPQILSLIPLFGLRLQDPLMDGSLMNCGGNPSWATIKQVQLLDVWRSDYAGLLTFLSSLPALEELVVQGCWERPYIPPNTLIKTLPSSLKKLDVDPHAAEDVFQWLLCCGGPLEIVPYLRVRNIWELDDDYGLHNTIDFMNSSSIRQVELHFDEGLEFYHNVPTPSDLWFRCSKHIEVLKLTGPLMVTVGLLIAWFKEPDFAPSLERLEIDVALWDADAISGAGHRFEHLDQQLSDRAGASRGKDLYTIFRHCTPEDTGLEGGRVTEVLSRHMWRLKRRGALHFVPRIRSN